MNKRMKCEPFLVPEQNLFTRSDKEGSKQTKRF